jgi:ABC-type multidrug transport system fused ATPase/permease subunit
LFIIGSTTAYLIWELLILAVFIGLTSLVTAFANGAVRDNESIQVEQSMKSKINIQLLNIESILFEKASHNEDISKITASFKRLKERINASTPFGRIRNNYAVTEMENKILSNLSLIEVNLSKPITGENKNSIENLIDETYRFVINREKLNIY